MSENIVEILPIPAFADNYIWLLRRGQHAVVVDPGDAVPVIKLLEQQFLELDAILVTHHHSDHIGGVNKLLTRYSAKVYAPGREQYEFPHERVAEQSIVHLTNLNLDLTVMEVPGHTLGHVAYYGANYLFCGDTLFGGGCGRLFEGTPAQMYNSLQRLAKLPGNMAVYCTHEYTEHNLRFAHTVEPQNPALIQRQADASALRRAGKPTLPSSIALELQTNPFLRCEVAEIQQAAGAKNADPITTFIAIRSMRNHY